MLQFTTIFRTDRTLAFELIRDSLARLTVQIGITLLVSLPSASLGQHIPSTNISIYTHTLSLQYNYPHIVYMGGGGLALGSVLHLAIACVLDDVLSLASHHGRIQCTPARMFMHG